MEDLQKEFIPYDRALRLKALGFNEPCFGYYNNNNEFTFFADVKSCNTNTEFGFFPTVPTFSQAFRWFRDKHNIHAEITWSPSYEYDPGEWSDAIYEITFVDVSYTKEWKAESPDMQRSKGKQLTYEEAELACLDKLLEIVESKQKENGK